MSENDARLERFLAFSAYVTAFSGYELRGTGRAAEYLSTVERVAGPDVLDEVLSVYERVSADAVADAEATDDALRKDLFSDDKLGPIARNILKMWYVGIWYELPPEWIEVYGARQHDGTFMVSPAAYTEGLLWPAIGANPNGAKPPGYGSWALPPLIEGWQPAPAAAPTNDHAVP
jgi:hypothetical protein